MGQTHPDRELYLAISEDIADDLFDEPIGRLLVEKDRLRLLVFDPNREAIARWTP